MADRIANCNLVTDSTALSSSVYPSNPISLCCNDSGVSPKKHRPGYRLDLTLSPSTKPVIDASGSVLKGRLTTENSRIDVDADSRSIDPTTRSPTGSSSMFFKGSVHESRVQSKDNQILDARIPKLRREQLFLESHLSSLDDHISPFYFNAEMLQLLHLSRSNTTPTRERVRRNHKKSSVPMPIIGKLSKWSNKYKHHDASYSCIDSMRSIIYKAAQNKARDIIRKQAPLINCFLKSHINTVSLDRQDEALLDSTACHTKYGHIIRLITLLMKQLPDHLKKDLMSIERTALMKIGAKYLQQAIGGA